MARDHQWHQLPAALEECEPPNELQRPLGVEAGILRLEASLEALPGDAEEARQLRLAASAAEVRLDLPDQLVP